MVQLRSLELKDAPYMLEWMHDFEVIKNLNANFETKKIEDCRKFIEESRKCKNKNMHLAIVNEEDVYLGTASLKNIDNIKKSAEFAITIRKCAMGSGISAIAMKKMLNIGKTELFLESIYWCVSEYNKRAIRFYNKNHYKQVSAETVPCELKDNYVARNDLIWYVWNENDNTLME